MSAYENMNGLWTGWYAYKLVIEERVPITVWFNEAAGVLSGTMLEPNTFANPAIEELSADINGSRAGTAIVFTKLYHPTDGVHQEPITYLGQVEAGFEQIYGEWTFNQQGMISGTFELLRSSRGVSEAIEKTAKVPVDF